MSSVALPKTTQFSQGTLREAYPSMKLKALSRVLPIGALVVASTQALAQETAWEFEGTLYVFAADTTLNVNGTESELSFSDALDNLEFGGMANFAASNQTWTFVGDLMYFDLLFENETPGPAFSSLDSDAEMTVFSVSGYYRIAETPRYHFNIGGGFRYFKTDTTLTLQAGALPTRSVRQKDSWTDPVIAAFGQYELSEKWRTTFAADYGSFVNDRKTYQVTLTFDYAFADNWNARFGYRYLNIDNQAADFRTELSGPVIGVSYRF